MGKKSQARIISCNMNSVEICASAARISTTEGDAIEIYENSRESVKNQEMVKKVLMLGHKSVIEHAVFSIAFCNVSAFVEQFFIESRLASFTVKSRRYVDFSKFGYYIPDDLEGTNRTQYCQYMDNLFSAYKTILEKGVPKEDARFLLPYSFNSNFYCTLNARELAHCINAIRYGRGKDIPELQNLADQIIDQIAQKSPWLLTELNKKKENTIEKDAFDEVRAKNPISFIEAEEAGNVCILDTPSDPLKVLKKAYSITHSGFNSGFDWKTLFEEERPRELEQLSYSFLISNITLSGITHIVRHRLQSILVPSIQSIDHSKYIVPDTIKEDENLLAIYKEALETANCMVKQMCQNTALRKYNYYYALSGNTMDIMTTMNTRELKHFIQLRSCQRAQWEIRKISIEMLKKLRQTSPGLFERFGPSCYVEGICPEGKLACGKMEQVAEHIDSLIQL